MCLHDADSRNVFNCDEINITNDPGMKKIIFRRGLCQIERKMELSKQSISIMFCGSATGEYLPPMIVCKVQKRLYWMVRSWYPCAIYDATSTRWFDSGTFERWFTSIFLNVVACRCGVKVVISDNLASHFSHNVI